MSEKGDIESFFENSRLTLDMVHLTDEERRAGSVFLGGSAAEFVESVEDFRYDQIETVVFRWGDEKAQDVFANLLEHIEAPSEEILPFATSTVVGEDIWILALQPKNFSTEKAYRSPADYVEVPYNEKEAEEVLAEAMASGTPKPIIGKVGTRYLLFEVATALES